MSTLSSHLNWGSSYISLDFYKRFVNFQATEEQVVYVGKISTVVLMVLAGVLALYLESALSGFKILLQLGAGTGLIFILRWFWWRVNAFSEITGMIVSFVIALYFEFFHHQISSVLLNTDEQLVIGVLITTFSWISVTLLTKPTDLKILSEFYNKVRPYGIGWRGFFVLANNENLNIKSGRDSFILDFTSMLLGIIIIYCSLFCIGFILYSNIIASSILLLIVLISSSMLFYNLKKTSNH